jgi:hypothetical protein
MNTKINLNVLLVCLTITGLALFMSFKKMEGNKKIALIKVYQTDSDFGNAITIAYPGGTTEKFELLPNKIKNYEANDKLVQKSINSLMNVGYQLNTAVTNSTGSYVMTQYIFEVQ